MSTIFISPSNFTVHSGLLRQCDYLGVRENTQQGSERSAKLQPLGMDQEEDTKATRNRFRAADGAEQNKQGD